MVLPWDLETHADVESGGYRQLDLKQPFLLH